MAVQRRLAAILAADVAGYSRLMGEDEVGTRARFNAHVDELIQPTIATHRGRIVKTTGDGLLVEFASVVDAVQCAVEVQKGMAERNADEADDRRIDFRIGINLGDVIIEGDDIHGDGINVAARLEGLAEPGGVVVSGSVHEHVRGKLGVGFDNLGPQKVKNIAEPVQVYAVRPALLAAAKALPLPQKPSIAVLPFANMSGDPEQEYFADGIAEDIITELSRFGWFFVIARNSSFTYKGKAVDVQRVSRELGVRYVLEGSVRKAGGRVRITAQLIDGATGNHVWAERYDRDLADIFAVQDEITGAIASTVAPSFVSAEARRLERQPPENLDAWEHSIRGNWHLWRLDKESLSEARRNFEAAIALDPKSVMGLGGLALACSWQVVWGWADDPGETAAVADRAARDAVIADEFDAWAYFALGQVHLHRRRLVEAERALRRAVELNPNFAVAHGTLSGAYSWMGRYDETIEYAEKASRLNPKDPAHAWLILNRAVVAFVTGRYEEQVDWAKKMTEEAPNHPAGWRFLSAGLALLGELDLAHEATAGLLRVVPHYTIELARTSTPGIQDEDLDRFLDGLRKAGLPE